MALAAAVLGFAPGIVEPFHAFKAVVLRAIGLPLLVWFGVEALSGRVRGGFALTLCVLGWVVAVSLATVFSIAPRLSLAGELSQREGLLTALALGGLALASAHAHRTERDVRGTLVTVLVCGVAAAFYAQLQLAGLDPIHWEGVHTYATSEGVALRPSGPLGNPILLGIALAAALPIPLAWLAGRDVRGRGFGDAAWLVPAAALVAASLVMTLSRGAWLAGVAGIAVGVALACAAGGSLRRAAWTTAASLAPALMLAAFRAAAPIGARLAEGAHGRSLEERAIIGRGALQLWRGSPWLGVGPDAFGIAFPRVQPPAFWREEWIGVPTHAHAAVLQILATLGLVGLVAGTAWLVAAALAWRGAWLEQVDARATLGCIAGVLAALFAAGATNVVGLAGATVFAVCSALPVALRPRPERAPGRLHPVLPAIAAGAMLLFVAAAGVRELSALALAQPARSPAPRGNATAEQWKAITVARAKTAWSAARQWPGEEMLWRFACDASLAEGEAAAGNEGVTAVLTAEGAAQRALALVPARASNVERLASALGSRALLVRSTALEDSAESLYARATSLAPADAWLLVSRIRFELARRDGERALASATRLAALYPEAAMGHSLAGGALLLLGRDVEARAALQRARSARWEEDAGEQRAALERLLQQLSPGEMEPAPRP